MNEIIDTFYDEYKNPVFSAYLSIVPTEKRQKRLHRHTEFEVSLILSGGGVYDTENGVYSFIKGDVFLYSTNEYHCITEITAPRGENLTLLNLHFSPAFIYSDDAVKDFAFMNVFFNRTDTFKNILDRNNPEILAVRDKFLKIKAECEEKRPCYKAEVKNLLVSILISIFRDFNLARFDKPSLAASGEMEGLQKAIVYINERFDGEIKLDDIATAACLSKFHFIRLFKASYNMTVWDYINIKRVDAAINLLSTTSDSVINVALKCGYSTPANFNRIFKKITGTSPKDYRKHLRRKSDG